MKKAGETASFQRGVGPSYLGFSQQRRKSDRAHDRDGACY